MQTIMRRRPEFNDGVLVPIPQYPLYSATCTLLDGSLVPYHLDEDQGWGLDAAELRAQLAAARAKGVAVRGLVVINPGNPTGNTLSEANMREVVRLCADEGLVLFADEVYQENIWREDRPFVSFRKVFDTEHRHEPRRLPLSRCPSRALLPRPRRRRRPWRPSPRAQHPSRVE